MESLVPFGEGVEIAPLAGRLSCFPKPAHWSVYLRRSVVPLSTADARLIDRQLKSMVGSREDNMDGYMARARLSLVG